MKKLIALALIALTLSGCGGPASGVRNYPGAPNRPGRGENLINVNSGPQG